MRGGSELGFGWFLDGRHLKKKNTFTDFIAVAEEVIRRRYTRAGAEGWLTWPEDRPLTELDALLREAGAAGVRLIGPPGDVLLGATSGGAFAERVRRALDPDRRFTTAGVREAVAA